MLFDWIQKKNYYTPVSIWLSLLYFRLFIRKALCFESACFSACFLSSSLLLSSPGFTFILMIPGLLSSKCEEILSRIYFKVDVHITCRFYFSLYRGGFVLFLFITCIGFNIWGWRTAGVNHILIFEIDPRQHLSHQHFFEVSKLSIFCVLHLLRQFIGELQMHAYMIDVNLYLLWV